MKSPGYAIICDSPFRVDLEVTIGNILRLRKTKETVEVFESFKPRDIDSVL